MSAQAQALVRSASNAGKQVLANPQIKQAVEQATVAGHQAKGFVSSHYEALMRQNRHYVLGNGPSFFVSKQNIHKVAFFTALAECGPLISAMKVKLCICCCRRTYVGARPATMLHPCK